MPAPEATHAIRVAIDEALRCKAEGKAQTILFNLSGHGHFDMQAYTDYFAGKLEDRDYDEAALQRPWPRCPRWRRREPPAFRRPDPVLDCRQKKSGRTR